MPLYLGDKQVQINFNGSPYQLNLITLGAIIDGIFLLSSDGFILQDYDGVYLTAKEGDE